MRFTRELARKPTKFFDFLENLRESNQQLVCLIFGDPEPAPRQTYEFNGRDFNSTDDLLRTIARLLDFDDGAGMNWNSFWDQMCGRDPITFVFRDTKTLQERMGEIDFGEFQSTLEELAKTQDSDFEYQFLD